MPDDPVRVALRAAATAGCVVPDQAALIVAAFLRALPRSSILLANAEGEASWHNTITLTNALENAAKGAE